MSQKKPKSQSNIPSVQRAFEKARAEGLCFGNMPQSIIVQDIFDIAAYLERLPTLTVLKQPFIAGLRVSAESIRDVDLQADLNYFVKCDRTSCSMACAFHMLSIQAQSYRDERAKLLLERLQKWGLRYTQYYFGSDEICDQAFEAFTENVKKDLAWRQTCDTLRRVRSLKGNGPRLKRRKKTSQHKQKKG